jgi:hypothetical protein
MALEFQQQHDNIMKKYASSSVTVTFKPGHIKTQGRTANQMKNPLWEITNSQTGEVTDIVMYCEPNQYCKLCPASYQKILEYEVTHNKGEKMTWYRTQNGYISCHSNNVFIHQVIMGTWGQDDHNNTNVVVHLDRNPLNNRYDNLRISILQEHQKYNSSAAAAGDNDKRKRKHSAKELPPGLTQNMMKRHVSYYHEWLNTEHTKNREFFKVEHPKLEKPWMTSKSEKVPLLQKLEHANQVASDLEKGIFPDSTASASSATAPAAVLPKYISLIVMREKPHLVYERRRPDTGAREGLRMVLPTNYTIEDEIVKMKEKVEAKYGAGAMD